MRIIQPTNTPQKFDPHIDRLLQSRSIPWSQQKNMVCHQQSPMSAVFLVGLVLLKPFFGFSVNDGPRNR